MAAAAILLFLLGGTAAATPPPDEEEEPGVLDRLRAGSGISTGRLPAGAARTKE